MYPHDNQQSNFYKKKYNSTYNKLEHKNICIQNIKNKYYNNVYIN